MRHQYDASNRSRTALKRTAFPYVLAFRVGPANWELEQPEKVLLDDDVHNGVKSGTHQG